MRILKILILLFILACISIVGDLLNENNVTKINLDISDSELTANSHQNAKVRTAYSINIEYKKNTHTLFVDEIIKWENIDSNKTDSLFLNLPKSSKKDKGNNKTTYQITSLEIDGERANYKFTQIENRNFIDSSLICVQIPKRSLMNDVHEIKAQFNIILPKEQKLSKTQFYNFENWHVTISPFIGGKFIASPTHQYIETFLEYSDFNVTITSPEEFSVVLPGELIKRNNDGNNIYSCSAKSITRFNWLLFTGLEKHTKKVNINSNEITLEIFIRNGKENYINRYIDGTAKYLKSLASFGSYPSKRLTIIDVPKYGRINNKSYPSIIALNTDLISPTKTQKFEYQLALVVAEQYFGGLINSNNLEHAWLAKGLSSFVAEKLVREHFGDLYSYFTIADYYPIFGLHFMSYAGIPLIYIVSNQIIPEGGRYLNEYYTNFVFADLSIPSYSFPSKEAYHVSSVVKPQIALLTLEKMIGEEKFNSNLEKYSRTFISKYPTEDDFGNMITKQYSQINRVLYNELFKSDKIFDYAIRSVEKIESEKYEILVERVESGVIPITLSVITESDTINLKWDGKNRFKVFTILSDTEVISAELDVGNKNLLDINFANNSYVVKEQYWGSVSYATRVFFWFQNALMLIGGKG